MTSRAVQDLLMQFTESCGRSRLPNYRMREPSLDYKVHMENTSDMASDTVPDILQSTVGPRHVVKPSYITSVHRTVRSGRRFYVTVREPRCPYSELHYANILSVRRSINENRTSKKDQEVPEDLEWRSPIREQESSKKDQVVPEEPEGDADDGGHEKKDSIDKCMHVE